MTRSAAGADDSGTSFLFSPSASYPQPFACLIDRNARLVHAWSNPAEQPNPSTDPPTYLRGWNHVELDDDGNLLAMVPLQALLKLAPDSTLLWKAPIPVHHDLGISRDGKIYALTEQPRSVPWRGGEHLLLDNAVTVLDSRDGHVLTVHSLYDVLTTCPELRALIDEEIDRRRAAAPDSTALLAELAEPHRRPAATRQALRLLRDLPGSPSDVLHANTIEMLNTHPYGLWKQGDVLVSLRNLNLIAAVDLTARSVAWFFGPGELSGQHQPSALPGGTVLVFDNGQAAGRSRVLEIDPATGEIIWQYTADPPQTLFSPLAGGCELLGNGHTLITDAQAGRAIEVTRDGRTVWGVQIHTTAPTTARSRAEIYRMSATRASITDLGSDATARQLVQARLKCELTHRSTP
ncbi:arylsulfotransferase family protein [Sphaerimonospora cavernae]|uniref:Arylsulfotransferase family protein n=1 Tax=Sphaerimonospora cavernae TaxID=1740611 RepID=A0ABV6TZS2_9ACTN